MSAPTLTFRPATLADAEDLAQLINSGYRGDASRAGWTTEADFLEGQRTDAEHLRISLARPDTRFLLAWQAAMLVGTVTLEQRGTLCYLGMLTILPTLQAQGLGRALLEHAEQFARREFNARRMEMVVIPLRGELIAWYERRGYRRTGRLLEFPGYQDHRFGRPLRPDLALEVLEKDL